MALLKRKRTSLPTEPIEQAGPFSEEPQADLSQQTEARGTVMGRLHVEEEPMLDPESQTTPCLYLQLMG
jgi:hypothetical protein